MTYLHEVTLEGSFLKKLGERRIVYLIAFGVALYYFPFISRQFIGDDWLWLTNAKAAMHDPILYLDRPMYGYFRPLNMLLTSIWLKLFGVSPYAFSLINILLHSVNTILLVELLRRFQIPVIHRNLAMFIFAFYMLNAPAIEWISVGHDLWVTLLCLLLAIRVFSLIERPRASCFLQILGLGLAATLFKESGIVSIGIYLLLLIMHDKNPFDRRFRAYTLLFAVVYTTYLVYYFQTRTVIDKELTIGLDNAVNMWYFLVHMVLPITARITQLVPDQLLWLLKVLKVTLTLSLPLGLWYLAKKGGKPLIFFIFWSSMFLSTIAVLRWDVGLFTLYPEKTISRFMYSATIGFSVAAGWLLWRLHSWLTRVNVSKWTGIVFLITFLGINLFATWQMSKLYFQNYKRSENLIRSFSESLSELSQCQTVVIYHDEDDPQVVRSGKHLRAILDVQFNLKRMVIHRSLEDGAPVRTDNLKSIAFIWNAETQSLEPLPNETNSIDQTDSDKR